MLAHHQYVAIMDKVCRYFPVVPTAPAPLDAKSRAKLEKAARVSTAPSRELTSELGVRFRSSRCVRDGDRWMTVHVFALLCVIKAQLSSAPGFSRI